MATLYTHQSTNIKKTWILISGFLVLIIGLGYFFSVVYGAPEILYIAVIFSLGMNIFSYWYSDKVVLAISGAKMIERKDNPELWNIVENLSITAGLPMPKLYIIEDSAPNALATGRDKEHAAVAVTSGLLNILEKNELEGVIAHELSHIGNRDILIATIIVVLVGMVSLMADFFFRFSFFGGRGNRDSGGRAGGMMMLIGLALAILSPIVAVLIQLAVSRKREFLADASGALLTRYPEGLANALKKISQAGRPMKRAHNATAHLFISSPFGGKSKTAFFAKMFMTHPPIDDRISALLNDRG